MYGSSMALKCRQEPPLARLPQPDGAFNSDAGGQLTVRAERHIPDQTGMPAERDAMSSALDIPQTDGAIEAGTRDDTPGAIQCYATYSTNVLLQDGETYATVCIP